MKKSVGLGLRHPFHNYVLENRPEVPWFEVITENYLLFDGAPRSFLNKIRELYPLVFHGVSLSIGSLEPIRKDYLVQLKKMIREFKPLWISDHLCWTYNGPENSHDLLPVPFTHESLKRITAKTCQVQDFLGQKIYLENPSAYIDFAENEFLEEDFISELCAKSGCGLLLDLNNLVVNQYNLGYRPEHYLEKIKNCEVRQIHLAGHSIRENVRIDTHDSDISREVLELIPYAKQLWPDANPMIEWDDKIPEIQYLLEQRNKVDKIWNHHKPKKLGPIELPPSLKSPKSPSDHKAHTHFWQLLKKNDYVTATDIENSNIFKLACPTPAQVGMNVYSAAYSGRLTEVLEKDFPVLKTVLNELFSDVMLEYLNAYPSVYDSIDFIGTNLAKFIAEHQFDYDLGVHQKIISDVAAFENLIGLSSVVFAENHRTLKVKDFTEADWSTQKLKRKSTVLPYQTHSEIHHVMHSVQQNKIPEIPDLKASHYLFYRADGLTDYKLISEEEFNFFNTFSKFRTFVEILDESGTNLQKCTQLLFENEQFFCID